MSNKIRTSILNQNGIKKLLDFYKENSNSPYFNESAVIADAVHKMGSCDLTAYEMSSLETKSRQPETVAFQDSDFEFMDKD